jgi:hypothetical protein
VFIWPSCGLGGWGGGGVGGGGGGRGGVHVLDLGNIRHGVG